MKRSMLAVLIFCLALPFTAEAKQKLYKWVDENGVTHYGAQPPANKQAEQIKVSTGHSEPSNNGASGESGKAVDQNTPPPTLTPQATSTKDPAKCEMVRKNLWNLETFPRVRVDDEKTGEKRYLTPDEHKQWLSEAKEQEKAFCE